MYITESVMLYIYIYISVLILILICFLSFHIIVYTVSVHLSKKHMYLSRHLLYLSHPSYPSIYLGIYTT